MVDSTGACVVGRCVVVGRWLGDLLVDGLPVAIVGRSDGRVVGAATGVDTGERLAEDDGIDVGFASLMGEFDGDATGAVDGVDAVTADTSTKVAALSR